MKDFTKYTISKNATIREALIKLDNISGDLLTLFVLDDNRLLGTLTDGDIRRFLITNDSLFASVEEAMYRNFNYIYHGEKNLKKIKKLRTEGIELLPVIDSNNNLIKIYDLKHKKSILPIDAVLMAGGKGERLRPLTENTPKPLLKIGSKPIIDYNIDNLISYGVENIYVTTNYLAEQLEEHFKKEKQGIKINCVREKHYLGTIASVKLVDNLLNDNILVMNSDLFTNIDFEDFYLHFLERKADMSVAAVPYSVNIPYGIFELEGRNIHSITEKPTYNYYANAGLYIIKKELLDLIPDGIFFNATDFIDLLVSKEKNVIRYPLTGYWIDIGKPADFQRAQEIAKHIEDYNV